MALGFECLLHCDLHRKFLEIGHACRDRVFLGMGQGVFAGFRVGGFAAPRIDASVEYVR